MKWRLLDLGKIHALAYEELIYVIREERQEDLVSDTLFICTCFPHLWIGKDHSTELEKYFNLKACKEHGLEIVVSPYLRRGGALLFEETLFWVWTGKESSIVPFHFAFDLFLQAQCRALKNLHLEASYSENDVLVNGRKIGGFSQARTNNVMTVAGDANITFDYNLADRLLTVHGKEGKDLQKWVTNLNRETGRSVTFQEAKEILKNGIESRFQVTLELEIPTEREQAVLK